jgi:hypothetical protein
MGCFMSHLPIWMGGSMSVYETVVPIEGVLLSPEIRSVMLMYLKPIELQRVMSTTKLLAKARIDVGQEYADADRVWRENLRVGDPCDARDYDGKWFEGKVKNVRRRTPGTPDEVARYSVEVEVEFRGWSVKFNEWVTAQNLAPPFTNVPYFTNYLSVEDTVDHLPRNHDLGRPVAVAKCPCAENKRWKSFLAVESKADEESGTLCPQK